MESEKFLSERKKDVLTINTMIHELTEGLSLEDLNREPEPGKWSILVCIQHMNLYSEFYIPTFKNAINQGKSGNGHFSRGWFGGYSSRSMLPRQGKVRYRMRAFKDKDPGSVKLPIDVVDQFIKDQQEILNIIEGARKSSLSTRVPTTLKGIRFQFGDALEFFVNHELRHLEQIKRTRSAIVQRYEAVH